jgi:hypothetical protein
MGKKYKSVLAMVKDLSDPEFAKEFEKRLKEQTVYVYVDVEDYYHTDVFVTLNAAKKYASSIYGGTIDGWVASPQIGIWTFGPHRILRRKIM